jgi:di/tricarboxylate transporter
MMPDQILLFSILGLTMLLFIWGRFRFEIVALLALLSAVLLNIIPADRAFLGLGHPAVITVAAILIISKSIENSGVLDRLTQNLLNWATRPVSAIALLTGISALLSAFMNNVGALALMMPIAFKMAANSKLPPSLVLMPLSFGTILGGLTTLMGTPPNIIIASYRAQLTGSSFSIFDFSPVGGVIAAAGVIFIALTAWILIPRGRRGRQSVAELFEINDYIIEARLPKKSPYIGSGIHELADAAGDFEVVGILRGKQRYIGRKNLGRLTLKAGDILILETDPGNLPKLTDKLGLELVGDVTLDEQDLKAESVGVMEAVIMPDSRLEKRSFQGLRLQSRYGIALLGISRQGKALKQRLSQIELRAGDVLLLQGENGELPEVITRFGCLPLADRGLQIGNRPRAFLSIAVFIAALILASFQWLPVHVAFCLAAIGMVLLNAINIRDAYDSIDWPVILLLAALIPLGQALETTGATGWITSNLGNLTTTLQPHILLAIVIVVTMTLSDIMNNAATAVIMAPISFELAQRAGLNADPFLMAVAVGASCAFLTPIGHQNNIIVMGPGGYRFGDYWRLGLPLEILVLLIAVPLIPVVWPF